LRLSLALALPLLYRAEGCGGQAGPDAIVKSDGGGSTGVRSKMPKAAAPTG